MHILTYIFTYTVFTNTHIPAAEQQLLENINLKVYLKPIQC